MNINELLKTKNIESNNDYSFFENDKELMNNLVFMTLSGSHAYSTNLPESDIDIRAIRMNNKDDILLLDNQKVETNVETDTGIYTINSILKYFAKCNPNVFEFLFDNDKNALFIHPYFQKMVLDNKKIFLSRDKIFDSFGGFAKSQVNRLNNKTNRNDDETIVLNLMRSIQKAQTHLKEQYRVNVGIELKDDIVFIPDKEHINIQIKNLDLTNCAPCLNEIATMCKNAKELSRRTKKQEYIVDKGRVNKHLSHYFRLIDMGVELLLTGDTHTYRTTDHDLLMDIRLNKDDEWLKDDKPTEKTMKLIEQKEKELRDAKDKSKLPELPNWEAVNKIIKRVNYDIITDNWKGVR